MVHRSQASSARETLPVGFFRLEHNEFGGAQADCLARIARALANILGDQKIGTVCLLLAVPGMILALTVLCLLVRETRGTDMTKVKYTDYDT